jgi:hypothetical protein
MTVANVPGLSFLICSRHNLMNSGSPGPQTRPSAWAARAAFLQKLAPPGRGGRPPFQPLALEKSFPRKVRGPEDFFALARWAATKAGVRAGDFRKDICVNLTDPRCDFGTQRYINT